MHNFSFLCNKKIQEKQSSIHNFISKNSGLIFMVSEIEFFILSKRSKKSQCGLSSRGEKEVIVNMDSIPELATLSLCGRVLVSNFN